jgi:Holliday junction resolvasome RuvABC endonuclease subunit
MAVLALDLGTKTGWALLSDAGIRSGVWKLGAPPQDEWLPDPRWSKLRRNIDALEAECPIYVIFFEQVWRHIGTKAAHCYGCTTGVAHQFCEDNHRFIRSVNVGTIKKHATGRGDAKKPEMIAAAKKRFPDQLVLDDNHADALCLLSYAMGLGRELYDMERICAAQIATT